jgi:hypothetical protein
VSVRQYRLKQSQLWETFSVRGLQQTSNLKFYEFWLKWANMSSNRHTHTHARTRTHTHTHTHTHTLHAQVRTGLAQSSPLVRQTAMGLVVFLLAYSTAYAETLTIAHVGTLLWSASNVPSPSRRETLISNGSCGCWPPVKYPERHKPTIIHLVLGHQLYIS